MGNAFVSLLFVDSEELSEVHLRDSPVAGDDQGVFVVLQTQVGRIVGGSGDDNTIQSVVIDDDELVAFMAFTLKRRSPNAMSTVRANGLQPTTGLACPSHETREVSLAFLAHGL